MRCLFCKYPLKNLTEHRCPECGRTFDPTDGQTFDRCRDLFRPATRHLLVLALATYLIISFATFLDIRSDTVPTGYFGISPSQMSLAAQIISAATRAFAHWLLVLPLVIVGYILALWLWQRTQC